MPSGSVGDGLAGEKVFAENPVAWGSWGRRARDIRTRSRRRRSRIRTIPVVEIGKVYGRRVRAIARSWQPRLGLAGTFDEEWKRTRWPALPRASIRPLQRVPTRGYGTRLHEGDEELR